MSTESKELKAKIEWINLVYRIPSSKLRELVKMAQDEVEVPDCGDCTHKRFHNNRGGLFV